MSEFMHFCLGIECKRIDVCQASKFPVIGKNDFSIAQVRPSFPVDRFSGFVVPLSFGATELLEFSCGNMELDTFRNRFKGRVAVPTFRPYGAIS